MATAPLQTNEPGSGEESSRLRLLKRLTLLLVALGVAFRLVRYLLQFPIWGDEAMLSLNFLDQDFAGMTHHLRNCQIAPILFLWGELAVHRLLGTSELAMRLLPFLAGMASLFLFWQLARLTLKTLACTFAVGILAVAIWPASMCSLVKPYSCDLLMSLALVLPAVLWLQRNQLRWLLWLAAIVPVALLSSYPAIFIAGAVSLALVPSVWQAGWRARGVFVLYHLLMLVAFALSLHIAANHMRTPFGNGDTALHMNEYWQDGFPPRNPFSLVWWLVLIHTGQMFAYPLGAQDGGSTLTFLISAVGAWQMWQSRQRALFVLCIAPFALGFVAALLHRYPYGAAGRLCQHVAPVICLMAGTGAAALVERVQSETMRRRWIVGTCSVLALIAFACIVKDLAKPYRDADALWARRVVKEVMTHVHADDAVVVFNTREELDCLLQWYLGAQGKRLTWLAKADWIKAEQAKQLWCICCGGHEKEYQEAVERLQREAKPWVMAERVPYVYVHPDPADPTLHCTVYRWVCPERQDASARVPEFSCWP